MARVALPVLKVRSSLKDVVSDKAGSGTDTRPSRALCSAARSRSTESDTPDSIGALIGSAHEYPRLPRRQNKLGRISEADRFPGLPILIGT